MTSSQQAAAPTEPRTHDVTIVLDDDPTGTQSVEGVPVLFEWSAELIAEAAGDAPAIHLLTNIRAFSQERAREITFGAARAAREALPGARLLLRGDSTLRGHMFEEYEAVSQAAFDGRAPVLLLVPGLPTAGRVTVGGVHLIEREGRRVPLHETEYAGDGVFSYGDARLLQWAEDRSDGFFVREAGREVPLARLRTEGASAVTEALLAAASEAEPAACVPDAETVEDMELIAEGLRAAEAAGAEVLVRSAPTFVGVLAGNLAHERATPETAPETVLVVVGSYVPTTTRQLAALRDAHPESFLEVDVVALAGDGAEAELSRVAAHAQALLAERRLAIVATPRERPEGTLDLGAGERIAWNLARVLHHLDPKPDAVVAKGGITSAVTANVGLEATRAQVIGPFMPGVALWQVEGRQGTVPYLVFPGNVGDDGLLREVVDLLLGG